MKRAIAFTLFSLSLFACIPKDAAEACKRVGGVYQPYIGAPFPCERRDCNPPPGFCIIPPPVAEKP